MPEIELLNIDCMEYMKSQPDNAFDLAIVDPPYGHGNHLIVKGNTRSKIATGGRFKKFDNSRSPDKAFFQELARVSKNQIIWGANHFADKFNSSGSGWIVWDKHTTGDFADCELAYSSFGTACKKFDYMWNGKHQGSVGGNVRLNEHRIHPTQKPVKLYEWLLKHFADSTQRVLDTHLGSGSSAIAAHYFGCDFVGCEIDPDYHCAARERFDRETRQQAMAL